jgi:hypothetical protein
VQVVGGMTWCIETCNFDVDVDLLFQENLTIGQKMYVTILFKLILHTVMLLLHTMCYIIVGNNKKMYINMCMCSAT